MRAATTRQSPSLDLTRGALILLVVVADALLWAAIIGAVYLLISLF